MLSGYNLQGIVFVCITYIAVQNWWILFTSWSLTHEISDYNHNNTKLSLAAYWTKPRYVLYTREMFLQLILYAFNKQTPHIDS